MGEETPSLLFPPLPRPEMRFKSTLYFRSTEVCNVVECSWCEVVRSVMILYYYSDSLTDIDFWVFLLCLLLVLMC